MRGEGVMGDRYQLRSCSWSKTPKRCSAGGKLDDFVHIDDDDVIILDFPESLKQKFKSSGVSRDHDKFPLQSVISIDDDDDDDDDDDTNNVHQPGADVEGGGGDLDSDDASSKRFTAKQRSTELDDDDDECQVIQEKCAAFRFSKCKQTFSRKVPSRNRFGLSSESGSSESDCSDCEVLEGSCSEVREQWERAFLRKKYSASKVSSSLHARPSDSHCDINQRVEVANTTEQHAETSFCFASTNLDAGRDNFSTFFATGYGNFHGTFSDPTKKFDCQGFSGLKPSSTTGTQDSQFNHSFQCRGEGLDEDTHANASFCNEEKFQCPYAWSSRKQNDKQNHETSCHMDGEQHTAVEHSKFNQDLNLGNNHHHLKPDMWSENFPFNKSEQPGKTQVQNEGSTSSPTTDNNHPKEPACQNGLKDSEKPVAEESIVSVPQTSDKDRQEKGFISSTSTPRSHLEDSFFVKKHSVNVSGTNGVETATNNTDPTTSTSGHIQDVDSTLNEGDIINEREKLKETDEYKKAIAAEWEARQRQLRIQAEGAQRLKKRRKLESMRLLDMERRQKQRVEEMRETQKKEEENMNLKDQLRAEVRKELNKLESTCIDMASLLRGLGIPVGGGMSPLSVEVNAAYKLAVLKFHPDRASRGDIRQQVEAEEKFKLISRMKEKFLFASCRQR